MNPIDAAQLSFDPDAFVVLNVVLGFVMFGVALDLRVEDFRRVLREPKGPAIGLVAQFLLLPGATFLLTRLLDPAPSIALGMILVASCPGGNLSNFFTHVAGGRTVLSIGMTGVSTAAAMFMTPLNLLVWGSLHPDTAALLHTVELSWLHMVGTVCVILGLPLVAGMTVAARAPAVAARLRRPLRLLSLVFFAVFVGVAFAANSAQFVEFVGWVAVPVAIHNAVAIGLGYAAARLARMSEADTRAIAIEVGIQNSGLGLVLVFDFFAGLGGMAVITAWWGIWHIVAGMTLALVWSRRPLAGPLPEVAE